MRPSAYLRHCPEAAPKPRVKYLEMHKLFPFSTIQTKFWRVEFQWPPKREFGPQTIFPTGKDFFSHVEAYKSAHGARSSDRAGANTSFSAERSCGNGNGRQCSAT